MSKKKAKQKKKSLKMPPLSPTDWLIYAILVLFLILAALATIILPPLIIDLAKPEAQYTAVVSSFTPFGFPLAILLFIFAMCLAHIAFTVKIPLWGRKDIQYGPPNYPKIYPLFMKGRPPVWISERKKRFRKNLTIITITVGILCTALVPLSFFPQQTFLTKEGNVLRRSNLTQAETVIPAEQITAVELEIYGVNRAHHTKAIVRLLNDLFIEKKHAVRLTLIDENGKEYVFPQGTFTGNDRQQQLEQIIQMKEIFVNVLLIEDQNLLDEVVRSQDLSETEQALLYELFSVE